jgi:hypothetical protein
MMNGKAGAEPALSGCNPYPVVLILTADRPAMELGGADLPRSLSLRNAPGVPSSPTPPGSRTGLFRTGGLPRSIRGHQRSCREPTQCLRARRLV